MRLRPWLSWALLGAAVGVGLVIGRPALGTQQDPGAAIGPDLYLQNCASCHGDQGEGTFRGPTLVGVGAASAHYWLSSGRMPLDEPHEDPTRSEPHFTDAQIAALVDYIAGLGDGPPIPTVDTGDVDLARGGELYRLNCASCHNWDGKGGALVNSTNAPSLHPVPTLQVAEAIRIGPGTMPQFAEDHFGQTELNEVVAYVEYLRTPRDAGGFGLGHWGPATETVAGFIGLAVLVGVTAWVGERRRRG